MKRGDDVNSLQNILTDAVLSSKGKDLQVALARSALVAVEKRREKGLKFLIDRCKVDVNTVKVPCLLCGCVLPFYMLTQVNGVNDVLQINNQSTLLHLAAYYGQRSICEFLVSRGADGRLQNKVGTL